MRDTENALPLVLQRLPIRPAFGTLQGVMAGVGIRDRQALPPGGLGAVAPSHLSHVHSPARATQIWDRVLELIRDPVQRFALPDGSVAIHVTGTLLIHKVDGMLVPYLWKLEELDSARLEPVLPQAVMLQGMPLHWTWLDRILSFASLELDHEWAFLGLSTNEVTSASYMIWLGRAMRKAVARHCDLRQLRRKVALALELDSTALRRAHRGVPNSYGIHAATLRDYNAAVAFSAELVTLEADAPQLIPLYMTLAAGADFPVSGEPVQRIKRHLLLNGFTQRDWRFIQASSHRLLRPMYDFYTCANHHRVEALDFLGVLCAMGLNKPPSAGFLQMMFGAWVDRARRRDSYMEWLPQTGLFAHIIKLALQRYCNVAPHQFESEFQQILLWASREGFDLRKEQRRAGWSWLLQTSQAHLDRLKALQELSPSTWPVPVDVLQVGGYEVRFLSSAYELWAESVSMRHCVDDYRDTCETSTDRVASVTLAGKQVATAMFAWWEARLDLVQIKGKANRPVDEKLIRLLNTLHVPEARKKFRSLPRKIARRARDQSSVDDSVFRICAITEPNPGRPRCKEKQPMKNVLTNTGGYIRDVEVYPVRAVPDTFQMVFSSRLLSARNPGEVQKNFELTLDSEALRALKSVIDAALG